MPSRAVSNPSATTAEGFCFALAAEARRLLDRFDDAHLAPFLAEWPASGEAVRTIAPSTLPVLRWVADLARGGSERTRPLTTAFAAAAGSLRWQQTYGPADFGPDFLGRYGWTELIGTRGPIPSTALAAGVLLLGPETDYPRHRHEAEEIYIPLSGTAVWTKGDAEPARRAPGTFIHHPSWTPHAMHTTNEPLLAFYLWRAGDLAQKSLIG